MILSNTFLRVSFFFCLLLFTSVLFAKKESLNYVPILKLGPKIGFVGAQISGDEYSGFNKLGLLFGATALYDFQNKWQISADLVYLNKGSRKNVDFLKQKNDITFFDLNIRYIELPFSVRRIIKKSFFAGLGITYSHLLSFSVRNENGPQTLAYPPLSKNELGVFGEIGLQINNRFELDIRSKTAITTTRRSSVVQASVFNKIFKNGWYNVDLNFTLVYYFNVIKKQKSATKK